MLDLCDAQSEIVDVRFPDDPHPPGQPFCDIAALRAEALGLVAPGRKRVTNRLPHRIALDTEPSSQVVGQSVRLLDRHHRQAERGEQRLLQRSSPSAAAVLCTVSHVQA
jgi:hypothetical protein